MLVKIGSQTPVNSYDFLFQLYELFTSLQSILHRTGCTAFDHISKHREESLKYDTQRSMIHLQQ